MLKKIIFICLTIIITSGISASYKKSETSLNLESLRPFLDNVNKKMRQLKKEKAVRKKRETQEQINFNKKIEKAKKEADELCNKYIKEARAPYQIFKLEKEVENFKKEKSKSKKLDALWQAHFNKKINKHKKYAGTMYSLYKKHANDTIKKMIGNIKENHDTKKDDDITLKKMMNSTSDPVLEIMKEIRKIDKLIKK